VGTSDAAVVGTSDAAVVETTDALPKTTKETVATTDSMETKFLQQLEGFVKSKKDLKRNLDALYEEKIEAQQLVESVDKKICNLKTRMEGIQKFATKINGILDQA
jgi:hypothetical protein